MILKATIILIACLSLPALAATDVPVATDASTAPTVTSPAAITKVPDKTNTGFSPLPATDKGRVLISGVHIPKTEAGVSIFYVLAVLSTPQQTSGTAFNATIYDVTNEPILVGNMSGTQSGIGSPSMRANSAGWIELDLPVGKHTLMLTVDGFKKVSPLHTEFIEVNIESQQVKHISLSQYGFIRLPYFGEILLEQKHYDFCSSLQSVDYTKSVDIRTTAYKKRKEAIQAYMASNAISAKATDFADYCQALTEQQPIHTASAELIKQFEADKTIPQQIKISHLKSWQEQPEKPIRYDLMHEYEAPKKVESGLAHGQ